MKSQHDNCGSDYRGRIVIRFYELVLIINSVYSVRFRRTYINKAADDSAALFMSLFIVIRINNGKVYRHALSPFCATLCTDLCSGCF